MFGHQATSTHKVLVAIATVVLIFFGACQSQTEFTIKDLRESTGRIEKQTIRIDNASGKDVLRKDEKIIKNYRHTVNIDLYNTGKPIDESRVREKVLDLYKLTPNEDRKVCVVPVEVPAAKIFEYDIEWTESIREGKIVEATSGGEGQTLGEYTVISNFDCQVTEQRVMN